MALELTEEARRVVESGTIEPNLILEIDGIPSIYGTIDVRRLVRFDEGNLFDDGLFFDTPQLDDNSKPYIDVDRTTKNITSQIQPDKPDQASVSGITVSIVDVNGEVTRDLTTDSIVEDPLSRRAKFYLGFKDLAHPDDSVKLFDGIVNGLEFEAGRILVKLQHPDALKRREIFPEVIALLAADVAPTDTTITVDDISRFITPQDVLRTYIRIDEEIIEYTGISGNQLTGCLRGQENTIAGSYNFADEVEVNAVYRIDGNPLDLALKIMLSGGNDFYNYQSEVVSFVQITSTESEGNSFVVNDTLVEKEGGVVAGSFCSVSGSASNDFVDRTILAVDIRDFGTVLTVDGPALTLETSSAATITFKSQYDVFNADFLGCKMTPEQVDVKRHQFIADTFANSFFNLKFLIEGAIEAQEFIQTELFRPNNIYQVPRQSRSSCAYTAPPLLENEVVRFDINTVTNPEGLKLRRELTKYYYNSINFKFNYDLIEDDFLRGESLISEEAFNRFEQAGSRPLIIESRGIVDTPANRNLIRIAQQRYLDRYKYAAEYSDGVQTTFGSGLSLEVADTVIFGDENFQLPDNQTQSRNFQARIMEIYNKKTDVTGGVQTFNLIDTNWSLDARYGVISPTSYIDDGSTVNRLRLQNFLKTNRNAQQLKWRPYIGELVLVHDEGNDIYEETRLIGFDDGDPLIMIVEDLSFTPSKDLIVDIVDYSANRDEGGLYKNAFAYSCPQVEISSGTSDLVFEVADPSLLFVDTIIEVTSPDYANISPIVRIESIVGTTITVDNSLGFTPSNGDLIEQIGFVVDEGRPYQIF